MFFFNLYAGKRNSMKKFWMQEDGESPFHFKDTCTVIIKILTV